MILKKVSKNKEIFKDSVTEYQTALTKFNFKLNLNSHMIRTINTKRNQN